MLHCFHPWSVNQPMGITTHSHNNPFDDDEDGPWLKGISAANAGLDNDL